MRVYIAGPISGYHLGERIEAFRDAEQLIESWGHEPVNPMNKSLYCEKVDCGDLPNPFDTTLHTWSCYMKAAITEMMKCDAIYLMFGWQKSRGARIEADLAEKLHMAYIDYKGEVHYG